MILTLTVQADDVRTLTAFLDHAVATGACPKCKVEPFAIAGTGKSIESHDTYAADGVCLKCREKVGVIRATLSTLFGLEEDEAVLYGRPRVY